MIRDLDTVLTRLDLETFMEANGDELSSGRLKAEEGSRGKRRR